MKKTKVIQIGGNLRKNGISSFIMNIYRRVHNEFEFIFINSASTEGYYKNEILSLGGKIYDIYINEKDRNRTIKQAKVIREIINKEKNVKVLHAHYYSNNGIFLKQAFLENVPIRISHCHQANNFLPPEKIAIKNSSREYVKKYATHNLAITEFSRVFFYKDFGDVMLTPIDFKEFYLIYDKKKLYKKYQLDERKKYLIFIGRFSEQKNLSFLISFFKQLSLINNCNLIIIGYGPEKEKLLRDIKENHLDKKIFLYPQNSNINELLNISELLVLPSLWEGLGIVNLEAQATGTRCFVSTNVPQECDYGLCSFLELKKDIWVKEIDSFLKKNVKKIPIYSKDIDVEIMIERISNIYKGIE